MASKRGLGFFVGGRGVALHEVTHVRGGTDDIDSGLDARAIVLTEQGSIVFHGAAATTLTELLHGAAGQALLSGGHGADPIWGAPAPAVHENTHIRGGADDIDSGLDARAIVLTEQGSIVFHGAAATTLIELLHGTAGEALLSGGHGANPSWGAPVPALHAATHFDLAADELELSDLSGVDGTPGDIPESNGASVSWVDPDGRYDPAAHRGSHESGGADELRNFEIDPALADETGSGIMKLVTVGENVVTGEILYLKDDGKFWLADADAAASMPALYLVLDATIAADAIGLVLEQGDYRNDDLFDWTPGNGAANLLFAHTVAGEMVQLANQPAGAGDQVQVVGHILNANEIHWNPSLELIQLS